MNVEAFSSILYSHRQHRQSEEARGNGDRHVIHENHGRSIRVNRAAFLHELLCVFERVQNDDRVAQDMNVYYVP